jgi:hypothetical protein
VSDLLVSRDSEGERVASALAKASDSDFRPMGRSAGFEGLRERASGVGVGVGDPVGGGGHGGEGEIWEMGEILKMKHEWRHPTF